MTPHRKKLLVQRFGQPKPSLRFENDFVRFLKKAEKEEFKKVFFDEDVIAIIKDKDLVEFAFSYASGEFLSFIKELKERESDRGIWHENISIDDWLSSFFEKEFERGIGNKLDHRMLWICEKRDFDCAVDALLKTVEKMRAESKIGPRASCEGFFQSDMESIRYKVVRRLIETKDFETFSKTCQIFDSDPSHKDDWTKELIRSQQFGDAQQIVEELLKKMLESKKFKHLINLQKIVTAENKSQTFLDDSILSSLGVFDVGVSCVSALTVEKTLLLAELAQRYKQEKTGGFFDFALPFKGFFNKIDVPLKLARISGVAPYIDQPAEDLVPKISELLSKLGDLKKLETDEEGLEILNNFSMWIEKQSILMLGDKPEKGKSRNPRI